MGQQLNNSSPLDGKETGNTLEILCISALQSQKLRWSEQSTSKDISTEEQNKFAQSIKV